MSKSEKLQPRKVEAYLALKIGNVENAVTSTGRGNCLLIDTNDIRHSPHPSSNCVERRQICNMCNAPKFTDEERTGTVDFIIYLAVFLFQRNVQLMFRLWWRLQ